MKHKLTIWGGFIGFTVSFATGFVAGFDIGHILFNASVGCLAGAFLFMWLADLLVESLSLQKRRAAANSLPAEPASPLAKTTPNLLGMPAAPKR